MGMDEFQALVDNIAAMTCVVSVEDLGDGKSGKYRIVTGNRAYIDSIENPAPGAEMLTDKFTPNAEYTNYLTRDLNFEDYCYKAAVQGKCLHSYAHPDRLPLWFNMTFLPVGKRDGNICYCTYTMEINYEASAERMSDISGDIASAVLETGIKLRGTNDYRATMNEIIKDIQRLCDAEHCCIMLMDQTARSCSVLCEAFSEDTKLLPMERYLDDSFYPIAESWESTVIAGSNCLIAKDEHDMQIIKQRNPVWYESLTGAMAKRIVMFPLKFNNEILGFIWVTNFDTSNVLRIKETLELVTFFIASEVASYLLLQQLEVLSNVDLLTGVKNRNAMNNQVFQLVNGIVQYKTISVVFADLNGLKPVNDNEGHNAGDALLKRASQILKETFTDCEVYRAGGDEFVVVALDRPKADLEARVEKLRQKSKEKGNVSFALGFFHDENGGDVRKAMHEADVLMYEDKKLHYAHKR